MKARHVALALEQTHRLSPPQLCNFPCEDEQDGEADEPCALLDMAIELHNEVHQQDHPGDS